MKEGIQDTLSQDGNIVTELYYCISSRIRPCYILSLYFCTVVIFFPGIIVIINIAMACYM
jgi:hypothetical protein